MWSLHLVQTPIWSGRVTSTNGQNQTIDTRELLDGPDKPPLAVPCREPWLTRGKYEVVAEGRNRLSEKFLPRKKRTKSRPKMTPNIPGITCNVIWEIILRFFL
jgi:hypothetical protein